MIVIITQNVTYSLKGKVSKFLFQPKNGLFVGDLSTKVRKELWSLILEEMKSQQHDNAGITMLYSSKTEQKFSILQCGKDIKKTIDLDGLVLFG